MLEKGRAAMVEVPSTQWSVLSPQWPEKTPGPLPCLMVTASKSSWRAAELQVRRCARDDNPFPGLKPVLTCSFFTGLKAGAPTGDPGVHGGAGAPGAPGAHGDPADSPWQ